MLTDNKKGFGVVTESLFYFYSKETYNTMTTIDNIIIYLRKSRSDDPSLSVEEVLSKHEADLQEYCEHIYGERIPDSRIFREIVSGETIADRPVMRHIMKLIEEKTYSACLVIEPQRLSRGDLEDCGRIINTFRYTNTLVITPPKTYNLSDEYDRKFFEMELMRGNDYLEYTKRILNRGRLRSAKEGNFIGTYAPYGYKKIKVGTGKNAYYTLEIVPEEADNIRMLYHLFVNEGYGFTKLAQYLDGIHAPTRKGCKNWSPAALKDMLDNPVYTGKIRWNYRKTQKVMIDGQIVKTRPNSKNEEDYVLVEGKHEAIIDEDTFQAALDRRGKNPRITKGSTLHNPFAGLLYCETCGFAMSYKEYKPKKAKNISKSMLCNNQRNCHTKSVQYDAFFDRVCSTLQSVIDDFEIKLKNDDGTSLRVQMRVIENLEANLKKLQAKDLRQKDAFDDGIYTKQEYIHRNAMTQKQIAETIEAIEQAKHDLPEELDYGKQIKRFTDVLNALYDPDLSAAEKNKLLKTCIDKIVYSNHMESIAGIGRYVDNIFNLQIFLRF